MTKRYAIEYQDKMIKRRKRALVTIGVGRWAYHAREFFTRTCHEKAARSVGLAMCMPNSLFPLFIPPSLDNSRSSCQSVSPSAILPAFKNTSSIQEERTKNAPLR